MKTKLRRRRIAGFIKGNRILLSSPDDRHLGKIRDCMGSAAGGGAVIVQRKKLPVRETVQSKEKEKKSEKKGCSERKCKRKKRRFQKKDRGKKGDERDARAGRKRNRISRVNEDKK